MSLVGLTVAQYVGLLAGVGGLVVVFYLLKLRRRRVAVPFGKLWEQVLMDRQATSLLQRLRRVLSLLLQLVLAFLLISAIADPRDERERTRGRDLVVLVDTSASMRARDVDRGDGRIGEARAWVRDAIGKLGPRDRMMIVQLDAQVVPLTPLVDDRMLLRAALGQLRATDTEADFARGLRLATDVLAQGREGHIVLLSDGMLGEARDQFGEVDLGDVELHWVPIGRGGRNVGVTSFSVRRYPIDRSTCEIFLEVRNNGEQDEHVQLTVMGDGQEMLVRRVQVPAGQRVHLNLPGQTAATQTLETRLALVGDACEADDGCPPGGRCSGDRRCIFHDDQPADDRAYALLPERQPIRVLAVSEGNLYLTAALLLDEYLSVTEMTPAEFVAWSTSDRSDEQPYDTIIFDGVAPPVPEGGRENLLYLGVEGEDPPVDVGEEVEGGIWFDSSQSRREHPILRYVSFGDFEVYRAVRVDPRPGDVVIGRTEERLPLLITREDGERQVTMLTFELRHSDLPMRLAWPVLLMNILSWYVEQDSAFISSYTTGAPVHLRVPEEAETAEVCGPGGCEHAAVHDGEAVFLPRRAGFYRVRTGEASQVVAVNLVSPRESRIEPAETLSVRGVEASEAPVLRAGVGGRIWIWLLIAAAAIVLLEWLTYHRRVTV